MSSLIQGYNYDIFISYRQKDNKGDHWVSEFVDALKTELESTFKEEISVYFDINPHDGLLETHDVDASLKEKLKCLIFIPIISRTYCDPKSFAWENEFRAFVDMASKDAIGLKLKLSNGNIASRVLPVSIHALDSEDTKLLEVVLNGTPRGIDFIYKEPGVDRPLSPKDNDEKNLNKTNYRNQINKVALAIKDLLPAILRNKQKSMPAQKETGTIKKTGSNGRRKALTMSVLATLLFIMGFIIFLLISKKELPEKSIAVLPFVNDSPHDTNAYFINGLMEDILNNLQKIRSIRVISRTSSEQYRNHTKSIPEIAKELGVNYIVEGSGQKAGNRIRLSVQLIEARKDNHLWGDAYEKEILNAKDLFAIQNQMAQEIVSELKIVITPSEKEDIEKTPTSNLEAYDAYLKGQFYLKAFSYNDLQTAMKYFELAREMDQGYALAYAGVSDAWIALQQMGLVSPSEAGQKSREAITKARDLDSNLAQVHYSTAFYRFLSEWNWKGSEIEFKKALELNPNLAEARAYYSNLLSITGHREEAIAQIETAIKLDPYNYLIKSLYGIDLLFVRRYDDAIKAFEDALKINPEYSFARGQLGFAFHLAGKYDEALQQFREQWKNKPAVLHAYDQGYVEGGYKGALLGFIKLGEEAMKNRYFPPVALGLTYAQSGETDKAIAWLEKGYEVRDPILIYMAAYCVNLQEEPRFKALCKQMNIPNK